MNYEVYGCTACHVPASIRVCSSKKKFKVFRCLVCGVSRRVENERPLFTSGDYLVSLDFAKERKLRLAKVGM